MMFMKKIAFCTLLMAGSLSAKKSVAIQNISGRNATVTIVETSQIAHTQMIPDHETRKFEIENDLETIVINDCLYEIEPHMHRTLYAYVYSGKLIPAPFYVRG